MELLQLRYFQVVAQLESITKAANHFRIPQPAMSQCISRLEHDLGDIKLFNRVGNRIFLNENGHQFLKHVDVILAELDDAVKILKTSDEEVEGTIRLLTMENRRFVFKCVSQFSKLYPNVSFQLSHDYIENPFSQFDLCVCAAASFRQMKAAIPLISEKVVLNVNEKHSLANRENVSLWELADEKFVTMSHRSTLYGITFDYCRASGFEPNVSFVCDDPYFVRKYVAESMGVALAPSVSWAGRFRSNTKLIPIVAPDIEINSYLLWDDQRYLTHAVRTFRDYLVSEAGTLPGNNFAAP